MYPETLKVSGYTGDAGDSLTAHNNRKFSTQDSDNDTYNGNCAVVVLCMYMYSICVCDTCICVCNTCTVYVCVIHVLCHWFYCCAYDAP